MTNTSLRRMGTLMVVTMLVTVLMVATSFAANRRYMAELRGSEEVPAVTTEARGATHFKLSKDGLTLAFKLEVSRIEDITMAHIHLGKRGENGPPVATLYTTTTPIDKKRGTLAKGTLRAADLTGPLQGKTLADLVREIDAGNAYVNVHTTKNPAGEIRGQISPK